MFSAKQKSAMELIRPIPNNIELFVVIKKINTQKHFKRLIDKKKQRQKTLFSTKASQSSRQRRAFGDWR